MKKILPRVVQLTLTAALITGSATAFGQAPAKPEQKAVPRAALDHLRSNRQALQLTDADIANVALSSETLSKKSGVKHLYLQQLYQGIEIHNAITNVSMTKDDKVIHVGNQFEKDVAHRVKTTKARLTAEAAVAAAAKHLQIRLTQPLAVQRKLGGQSEQVLFSKGGISLEPIPAKLVYQSMSDGSLRLAWEVSIYELNAQNWWNIRLDATTGEFLEKDNMVSHCVFENDGPLGVSMENRMAQQAVASKPFSFATALVETLTSDVYNVLPLITESPSFGPRVLVGTDAADKKASPKGWQYSPDGTFTTTRGNNVFAYEDPDNTGSLANYSPDGGATFNFNFPVDFTKQPVIYRDAATTNLFYWNNLMHDVWYQYGFDEVSGNFQYDTFGKGGAGDDPVFAEAQDSRNIPIPPPGQTTRNNANFATPPDGYVPRMQMYLWAGIPDKDMFRVTAPATVAGSYPALEGSFSKRLTPTPITGKLVVAQTAAANSAQGCSAFTNAAAIAGNIAVVYRGSCAFADKVQNAQKAGAIAVVVINNATGPPIVMGGTPTVALPAIVIPSVMISQADGKVIQDLLTASVEVAITLKNDGVEVDGDFDNGIISHEYGHGISNRLTGGPGTTSCLPSAVLINNVVVSTEQMGEGWSDWFGLMMTMKSGDTPAKSRGIGTYASGQPTTGGGIRPAPYSTDFKVNGYTYKATNSPVLTAPHGVGFVWATMLWDMTWDLIGKYGFDAALYTGKGGNNIAMQLVIDGLKLQNCRPGFVDGRDAILLADRMNYAGANQELIWRAFARRGLGFSAKQGSNLSRFDQVEAYDIPPMYACSAPSISVSPANAGFAGAAPNTIYLGYGAQTVTLTASGDLTFAYSWAPAAGLSDPAIANPVFAPTAAGNYVFTVTAVNSAQCTRTASVTIHVMDVRCGNKLDKVQVCHKDKVLCISADDVVNHLTHGDVVGSCEQVAPADLSATTKPAAVVEDLTLTAAPNPAGAKTNLAFTLASNGAYRLEVMNMQGALVTLVAEGKGEAGQRFSYEFSKGQLASGLYMARLVSGNKSHFARIILLD